MVHWFKKHPDFLRSESHALSHDGNYKELFQKRDQLFVSHGHVVVRLDKAYRYPILIIYSLATPYILPEIYPLRRELTEEEVSQIASTYNYKLPADAVKFYYNLRHQNGIGSLCFLEWDAFDGGGQFYGVTSILARVKDWYKGHTTGEFPPDSEEIALFNHFTVVNTDFQILYPGPFVETPELVAGEFYATEYFLFAKNTNYSSIGSIYFGSYITGINEKGLATSPPEPLNLPDDIREEGLNSSLDIQTKPDLVKRLVQEGRVKEGIWFDVTSEPSPFQHFSDLVSIIGSGSHDEGIARLSAIAFSRLRTLPDEILIAIRFPNRKGQREFQAFIARKVPRSEIKAPLLFGGQDQIEITRTLAENYSVVEAVSCEKLSDDTFFQRNAQRAERAKLKDRTVNILGVGALGSEIADSLGKAGIGTMLLVDNQRMNAHNVVRHATGLRQVGLFKVHAMRKHIQEHNPFIEVLALPHSVTGCDVGTELPENSLTISSIADDNVESFVNEQSVVVNKSVFYARALRGGKVGRIIRVIPGTDACLNCLRLYRQDDSRFIDIPLDPDFPTLRNECNNPILPASAADLKLISALTSRLVIDHLQNGNSASNHWIWASEVVPGTPLDRPYSLNEQFFEPHAHCQFCNGDNNPKSVNIDGKVLEEMIRQVVDKKGIETGGVLAGYVDEHKNVTIRFASGPGPKAVETASRFEKDVEFCQKFLDDLYKEHGSEAVYLGEWHSHPNENNRPSNTDLRSLNEIANQKEYLTDQPIMIIFTKSGVPSCTVHPAGKIFRNVELRTPKGSWP